FFSGTSSATDSSTDLKELMGLRLFNTEPDLGSGCLVEAGFKTYGLGSTLGVVGLSFLAVFVGFSAGEFGLLHATQNRNPKDFSLCSLSTELEISKNRFFIGQVKHRVRSWMELMLPLKVIDDQLGYAFTWAHKSASKMSKLDRYLISKGVLDLFPHLSALCLDRHLSDHRPILLWETIYNYGPFPFRFFHSWKINIQQNLSEVDKFVDQGKSNDEILIKRITLLNDLQEPNNRNAMEISQKAKIRWSIEGDENSKCFHEVKRAVWDCGTNKSPGPDGFSFEFCRKYWTTIDDDVFQAVKDSFVNRHFPRGCNSSFIALIPKIQDAKFVKYFPPISLIGSVYKIIAKILANRLCVVLSYLKSDVQSAFVANRQILDGPFILNELLSWSQMLLQLQLLIGCSIIIALFNYLGVKVGSKMSRITSWDDVISKVSSRLSKWKLKLLSIGGLKQGDPISPFLFILIMETLYLTFKRVLNASLYKGISLNDSFTISQLFYADDVVFISEWNNNNIQTLLSVLRCFYLASGLKINLHKSKLMRIGVSSNVVVAAASLIGYSILIAPFNYLGVKVGSNMSRITSRDDVISKVSSRLSKWKLKLLSIGGRLSLLKSVLTSILLYHMSIFKVPMGVLNYLESIRRKLFYGVDGLDRKLAWIGWNMVLTSIKNDAIFGNKGALDTHKLIPRRSPWQDVILAIHSLQSNGEVALKVLYKRLYALEMCKSISVAKKWVIPLCLTLFVGCQEMVWSLEGSQEFSAKSSRILFDKTILPKAKVPSRWLRVVPIKVNVHAWRVCLDKLPTRANLSLRGMNIPSIACPFVASGHCRDAFSIMIYFIDYHSLEVGFSVGSEIATPTNNDVGLFRLYGEKKWEKAKMVVVRGVTLIDGSSLWTRFTIAIFSNKGALDPHKLIPRRSPWQDVILAIHSLQSKGEVALKVLYKRLYALEMCKSISVAKKTGHPSLSHSFCRMPRDRWCLSLKGSQEFSTKSSRILIDKIILPKAKVPSRWLRVVPIKVNVHAWRVCLDKLPTRANLSLRGMDIPSIACPFVASGHCRDAFSIMIYFIDYHSLESVLEIKKIKKEQAKKKKRPRYTIMSTNTATLKEFDHKSALYQTMHNNKTFNRNHVNHALYYALMKALIADKGAMDKGVADTVKDHKRQHDDDDEDDEEGPSAGSNQGKAPSKGSKIGKSATAKTPVEEPIEKVVMDDMENNVNEDAVNVVDQPQEDVAPNTSKLFNDTWFIQPPRPPTFDHEWNTIQVITDEPGQQWFNDLLATKKDPFTFDVLMDTPVDFTKFALHGLKVEKLTRELLVGLVYKILKGTCTSSAELEYTMKECFKALINKLDRNNPKNYFFNNELEFLKSFDPEKSYTTSITKIKAARYDLNGIEDMIPRKWSKSLVGYDKEAKRGIKY
nr:RNA-directed DNA polymerase, eukaryota [Tanacetum cinerariifolium]